MEKKNRPNEVFIDSEHLTDLRTLPNQVAESKIMVVLLSKLYLTRPWCLVELYFALKYKIPIITVNIIGAGYNFDDAKKYLESLNENTLDQANDGASSQLIQLGIDIQQLGQQLSKELPNIIAHEYNPNTAGGIREAQLQEILKDIIKKSKNVNNAST